jgi:hypothetical protein
MSILSRDATPGSTQTPRNVRDDRPTRRHASFPPCGSAPGSLPSAADDDALPDELAAQFFARFRPAAKAQRDAHVRPRSERRRARPAAATPAPQEQHSWSAIGGSGKRVIVAMESTAYCRAAPRRGRQPVT